MNEIVGEYLDFSVIIYPGEPKCFGEVYSWIWGVGGKMLFKSSTGDFIWEVPSDNRLIELARITKKVSVIEDPILEPGQEEYYADIVIEPRCFIKSEQEEVSIHIYGRGEGFLLTRMLELPIEKGSVVEALLEINQEVDLGNVIIMFSDRSPAFSDFDPSEVDWCSPLSKGVVKDGKLCFKVGREISSPTALMIYGWPKAPFCITLKELNINTGQH